MNPAVLLAEVFLVLHGEDLAEGRLIPFTGELPGLLQRKAFGGLVRAGGLTMRVDPRPGFGRRVQGDDTHQGPLLRLSDVG